MILHNNLVFWVPFGVSMSVSLTFREKRGCFKSVFVSFLKWKLISCEWVSSFEFVSQLGHNAAEIRSRALSTFSYYLLYMSTLNISSRMFLFWARDLRFVFQKNGGSIFACLSRALEYN